MADVGLRAGVGKCEISTTAQGVVVHDPLYAKALLLDDGNVQVVIIAMDAVAIGGICDISDDFLPVLRSRIESELHIPGQHILVNASHTHTADPMLCQEKELINRTFIAVKQATEGMTDVTFGSGTGYEDRIMINRTLRLKDGSNWTIRQSNPCPPDDDIDSLGPVDPEIGLLRFNRLNGTPLAVIYNFACHPLIGVPGASVTANYPGFASSLIETTLGHDCMAMFLQGAGGDVTELLYKDVNRPRDSELVGQMLGMSALKGLSGIETGTAALSVISRMIKFPRRKDIPERIKKLLKEQNELLKSLRFTSLNFKRFLPLYIKHSLSDKPFDYLYRYLHAEGRNDNSISDMDSVNCENIQKYLENIKVMEKLARIQDKIATLNRHQKINDDAGGTDIDAEIVGIKIGDCVLISCPAEALVEIGLNVKKASPYNHTFMAAFSNGYMHYGAPASYYDKGGYEVTECFLAPEWQTIYEECVHDIINKI